MRYVELFRHTENDGDTLTAEGMKAAEEIGRERLSPPYAFFGSTGARRATHGPPSKTVGLLRPFALRW